MTANREDLTRNVLGVICLLLLIAGSLWVLRPFLAATVWATMLITCLTLLAWPRPVGATSAGSARLGIVASSSGASASAPYLAARIARSR